MTRHLPELEELERLIELGAPHIEARVAAVAKHGDTTWPLWVVTLGNPSPDTPVFGCFGGVHGLERIGSAVVLAFLRQIVQRLSWDATIHELLARVRLVFMPVVNPGGMARGTRANPQSVDLMRNAPIDADAEVPFLIGGHRRGPHLPWYRGAVGAPMEVEAAALCETVQRELLSRTVSVALDCHSGFGLRDRVWFPYAHTREPIRHLPELLALTRLLDTNHPHHTYVVEPQNRHYLAHGDLWDHLHRGLEGDAVFLPLTLEMGSWLWVRKNPRQLFSRHGMFNPQVPHRIRRVLRRHLPWLDFLARAVASHRAWLPGASEREAMRADALRRWYAGVVP